MTIRPWRRATLVASALTLLVAVAAGAAFARQSAAQALAADKSTLVVAIPDDAATLDPLFAATVRSTEVIMNSYATLNTYGLKALKGGLRVWDSARPVGDLLAGMRVSPDGKTWTLTVRKGRRFADGSAITAATLKFMFDRNFGVKGSGGAFMYQFMGKIGGIDSVKQTGPSTLTVSTQVPNPLLPRIFALSNSVAFNPSVLAAQGGADPFASTWVAKNTAGAGPYQLSSWAPGSKIVLSANPFYAPKPAIKTVVMQIVPSAANRMLLLRRGTVDVVERLSAQEIKQLQGATGVKVVSVPSANTTQLVMNTKTGPLADARVRQAINYAVPYAQIISSVYGGKAQSSTGPVPVGFPLRLKTGYPYSAQNLAKARSLLAASGEKNISLPLQISSGAADHEAVAVLIRDALSKVGISVSIQKLTPAVFAEQQGKRQLEFFLIDSLWWVGDPSYALTLGYTCGAFFNYGNYCNKSVDELVQKAGETLNNAERASLYGQAQKLIIADAPMAWVAQPNFNLATRTNISGYAHFPDEMVRFKYLAKG
ncbi:MAG: ABC transporter substrate-binding protein [Gaiellales bacterium]